MTPEQKFKQWLIRNVLSEAHVQTIETSTGSGVPDTNACLHGKELWIEVKVATPTNLVLLRPYQWAWMQRRVRVHGTVLVIAECGKNVWVWNAAKIAVRQHAEYLEIVSMGNCYPKSKMASLRNDIWLYVS